MKILDHLPFATCRTEAYEEDGTSSVGTGFYFNFEFAGRGNAIALITNRHVVQDAVSAVIFISVAAEGGGVPEFGGQVGWTITNLQASVITHPREDIDLAAIHISGVLDEMQRSGQSPFLRPFSASAIPAETDTFSAVEEVLMIGYPNGHWDKAHNIPITRRGITATPYMLDFEGEPMFLVDCATFWGSSGSPIVLASSRAIRLDDGTVGINERFGLMGLLYAGAIVSFDGEIQPLPIPASAVPVNIHGLPMNLGYCIKSRMILDLFPILDRMLDWGSRTTRPLR
jgi:hypothetical protein